jgi:hypothetical protein
MIMSEEEEKRKSGRGKTVSRRSVEGTVETVLLKRKYARLIIKVNINVTTNRRRVCSGMFVFGTKRKRFL